MEHEDNFQHAYPQLDQDVLLNPNYTAISNHLRFNQFYVPVCTAKTQRNVRKLRLNLIGVSGGQIMTKDSEEARGKDGSTKGME